MIKGITERITSTIKVARTAVASRPNPATTPIPAVAQMLAAVVILSQLLKPEMAEREVRSISYHMKAARFGDLFYDIEGQPHFWGGLEYLHGVWFDGQVRAFWAHDHDAEARALA